MTEYSVNQSSMKIDEVLRVGEELGILRCIGVIYKMLLIEIGEKGVCTHKLEEVITRLNQMMEK